MFNRRQHNKICSRCTSGYTVSLCTTARMLNKSLQAVQAISIFTTTGHTAAPKLWQDARRLQVAACQVQCTISHLIIKSVSAGRTRHALWHGQQAGTRDMRLPLYLGGAYGHGGRIHRELAHGVLFILPVKIPWRLRNTRLGTKSV